MRLEIVGGMLLCASALLYAARYIAAALFMGPGLRNWDARLFQASYKYVGNGLTTWSVIALVAGLAAIIGGYVLSSRKQGNGRNKTDSADAW